jgi:hypothetical protein
MHRPVPLAWLARPLLVVAWALVVASSVLPTLAHAQAEPHYWKQRVFFIPYQPTLAERDAAKLEKIQLLVSRDGGQQWAVLQEAEPNVRGFSYHAAADGEYAFAVRMVDRRGKLYPEQIAAPLLRVVVDTQPPALQLTASLNPSGQIDLRYEGRDTRLKPQSLRIEAQGAGGQWQRIAAGPPDVNQPDRLLGQAAWRPPTSSAALKFRVAVDDAAGNQGTAVAEASLVGPVTHPSFGPSLGPTLAPPAGADGPSLIGPADDLQATTPTATSPAMTQTLPGRSSLEWPTNNSLVADAHRAGGSTPPFQNVYTSGSTSGAGLPPATSAPGAQFNANDPIAAPSLLPATPPMGSALSSVPSGSVPSGAAPALNSDGWTSAARPSVPLASGASASFGPAPSAAVNVPSNASGTPWVNSLTFDLDYDIQTVGPWGVAKVELWGTKDGGRIWQSLGLDQDNRSPMRVTVPAQGVYGFRIVVDGGNGVAAPTPQAGEQPELIVGVDMSAPQAELRAPELGQGPLAGHVLVRWSATDSNLSPRPIGLFYSAAAEGPWTTIATDLDNAGEYAWRLGRDAPPRVFLRLEARDEAGNVAIQQSPTAVDLNLPRPTGRLRNVRPVQSQNEADPDRYRTASGARPTEG